MTSFFIDYASITQETLAAGEFGVVTATGSIRNNNISVFIPGSDGWLMNDGTIFALAYGVFADGPGVVVENRGRISGGTVSTFSGAIFADNSNFTLLNSGTVSGRSFAVTVLGSNGTITNSGSIVASSGIAIDVTTAAGFRLSNSGSITVLDSAGLAPAALRVGAAIVSLSNTGVIEVPHAGLAVDLYAAAAVQFTNSGTIRGSVTLSNLGFDRYDGTGGHVLGVVQGQGGDDLLIGGSFMDSLDGGDGNDSIHGAGGNDILFGGSGDDTIQGGEGDDYVLASLGEDQLEGGAGNDTLLGEAGPDVLDGGDGIDIASYLSPFPGTLLVDLTDETNNLGEAAGDIFISIEGVEGGNSSDTLRGDAGANILIGRSGNDLLDGRAGADTLRGGNGDDLYTVDNAKDRVIERSGQGFDTVETSVTYALSSQAPVEVLRTTNANATSGINLTGSDIANAITGNAGANRLAGRAGDDSLDGGAGDDTLVGGQGSDQLTGGAGLDAFLLDSLVGADTILDFAPIDDVIQLSRSGLGFTHPVAALNANAFAFGTAATTNAHRFLYDTATGTLRFDADGLQPGFAPVVIATLAGTPAVTLADFIVVA